MRQNLRINGARLLSRLQQLAREGARPDGGVCRLALSDADKAGRDLVVQWMRDLGLTALAALGNYSLEEAAALRTPFLLLADIEYDERNSSQHRLTPAGEAVRKYLKR